MTTPWKFTNAIDRGEDIVRTSDNPEVVLLDYNPFIINRSYSRFLDTVMLANELNQRTLLSTQLQHDFFINTVKPGKRFAKWVKPEKLEDIAVIKEYYDYNNERAREALQILTVDQIEMIRKKLFKGGVINEHKQPCGN